VAARPPLVQASASTLGAAASADDRIDAEVA
jgi:hypothetical protein